MTDPIHEQISAFLDGELPTAESELLLKRLQRDGQLRNTVGRYSLIGEALRSTEAGGLTRDFASRVSLAIEQEASPAKGWRPVANWLRPVAGGAIAAGVAAVALVSLRVAPVDAPGANLATAIEIAPIVADTPLPQREVPPRDIVSMGNGRFVAPPIQFPNTGRLANFVVAHSEYSTPLGRRNVLTGLLAEEAIEQNDALPDDNSDAQLESATSASSKPRKSANTSAKSNNSK